MSQAIKDALNEEKNRLREIRQEMGHSGYDLQHLSSIPAQDIYKIERVLKRLASYEKHLIAQALNLPEAEIFPEGMEQEIVGYQKAANG